MEPPIYAQKDEMMKRLFVYDSPTMCLATLRAEVPTRNATDLGIYHDLPVTDWGMNHGR